MDYVLLEGSSVCTPSCSGKACGDDGCGNSCGSCGTGEACTASSTCEPVCTPNCSGKVCGDDGCGNSCGNCASGQTCTIAGQCASSCTASCSGKNCGSDGCGGSCGTCASGNTCSAAGQCVPTSATRTIRLEAEMATLAGCTIEGGGDSGTKVVNFSAGDTICWPNADMQGINGVKVHYGNAEPSGDILNLSYAGTSIATFNVGSTGGWSSPQLGDLTKTLSGQTAGSGTLCLDGSGSNWLASIDYVEVSGPTCTPNCSGKTCGSDGCGGTCGSCPSAYDTCSSAGQCTACVPNCSGKTCGSNGCGGSCGTCSGSDSCDASGQCVACVPNCSGKTCGSNGCGGSCGTCEGALTCTSAGTCSSPGRAQYVPAGYSYVWGDDFGGVVGQGQAPSAVNSAYWTFQNLRVNHEAQNYTTRQCTTHSNNWNYCVQDGRLRMQARAEALDCSDNGSGHPSNPDCADHFGWPATDMAGAQPYTSARLITKNKVAKRYGYIEFRAKLPHANLAAPQSGSWTAIWLLGQNIDEGPVDTRRPACTSNSQCNTMNHEVCDRGVCAVKWPWTGENDIMEWKSRDGRSEMAHNLIWIGKDGNYEACNKWPENGSFNCGGFTGSSIVKAGPNGRYYWDEYGFNHTAYHTYGLLWTASEKSYYVDGVKLATATIGASEAEFQQEMFIIMNYALGGDLGGTMGISDWANAYQDVDYIEWYQSATCTPNCTNKTCGGDGCDGICGTCGGGQICNGVLQCTGTLEAEDGTYSGVTLETINDAGRLRMDSSGDYVCWSGVNMNGVSGVKATYANGEPPGDSLIFRYDGTTVGTIPVANTGSWSVDTNTTINFSAQSGTGTICVESAASGAGWIASLNSITLL